MSRKNFVHSFTRKQGLGKVSLYHLETPTQKFEFTSPLGIKTLYPSSSVDMVRPVWFMNLWSTGCHDAGCFKDEITYDVAMDQIVALMSISTDCQQTIHHNCSGWFNK